MTNAILNSPKTLAYMLRGEHIITPP